MIKIAPSILTANFAYLGETVKDLEKAGADWLHCDVMDGVFVPNLTFGPKMIQDLKPLTNLCMDVHLMVDDPRPLIGDFIQAGADLITVHLESAVGAHIHRALNQIRSSDCRVGISLNPGTVCESLEHVYEEIDLILLMSVNPGYGGQSFIPQTLRKIEKIAERVSQLGLRCEIEVDGGINPQNAASVISAGATVLVAGSAIVNSGQPEKVITELKRASNG